MRGSNQLDTSLYLGTMELWGFAGILCGHSGSNGSWGWGENARWKIMLTYSLRTNVGLRARFDGKPSFDRSDLQPSPDGVLALDQHSCLTGVKDRGNNWPRKFSDCHTKHAISYTIDIFPSDTVNRITTWDGMAVELVQTTAHHKVEFHFRAPFHLLIAYKRGVRRNGETLVEGLPRSMLRDIIADYSGRGHSIRGRPCRYPPP
jgi:hypothetical protein